MTPSHPRLALLVPPAPSDDEVLRRMRRAISRCSAGCWDDMASEAAEVALNCMGEVEQIMRQRCQDVVRQHLARLRSPEPMLRAELLAALESVEI